MIFLHTWILFMKKFVFKLVSEIWTKKLKLKWVGQIIETIFFENFFSL